MHSKAHLRTELPQRCHIPGCLCAEVKIPAAKNLSGVEQSRQNLPAECSAVQCAELRKRRTVHPLNAACLQFLHFLPIGIEIGERSALFHRHGICGKSKCAGQQSFFRRTVRRRTQDGTVSQMNAVKEAQRHGALPLQRLFYCDKFRHASDLSF